MDGVGRSPRSAPSCFAPPSAHSEPGEPENAGCRIHATWVWVRHVGCQNTTVRHPPRRYYGNRAGLVSSQPLPCGPLADLGGELGLNKTEKSWRLTDRQIDAILLGRPAPEPAADGNRIVEGAPEHQDRTEVGFGDAEVRVHSASLLWIKESALAIEARCARLERVLERQNGELRRARRELAVARRATHDARLETIDRLVAAAEEKDHETAAHIERIGQYAEVIARALALPDDQVATIRASAPMHDVGKLGVPDAVLKKSSRLTSAEWGVMKQHTVIGARMLEGSSSPLLQAGAAIALSHHERWDGAGYPHGIAGEEIPLEARICAVADVYDALSSDRCYREALPNETAREMMESQRGRHFDPLVLDAFLGSRTEIEAVRSKF